MGVKSLKAINGQGRVYLKYGKPTQVLKFCTTRRLIPTKYGLIMFGKSNKCQICLYDRDLATNEYELLHSMFMAKYEI